jgi:segregation and condensation protein B
MSSTPSPDLLELGQALRARRIAVGLTLTELANLAEISAAQISRIETGRSRPSYDTLIRLRDAVGLEVPTAVTQPARRQTPDDGVVARLGAILAARHSLSFGNASKFLDVQITTLRDAAAELAQRLAPVGMTVVEDGETLALLPHRALAGLVARVMEEEATPRLTPAHLEVLAIVVHTGTITRRRVDEIRGVDSAETVAQLVEWQLLRREGREKRAPLYRPTLRLVEITGASSLEELRHRLREGTADLRGAPGVPVELAVS